MRITTALSPIILTAFLQSACSTAQSEPTPAPAPTAIVQPEPEPPAPPPAPARPKGKWIDWPLTEGDWIYRADARGSIALFGTPGADAIFIVRCYRDTRRIFLSQKGSHAGDGEMTLRASSGLKSFAIRDTGGTIPYTAAMVEPGDYMLDRIAYSRGRFAVETKGLQSLAIPIWPEFTRVVEDCRT